MSYIIIGMLNKRLLSILLIKIMYFKILINIRMVNQT